MPSTIQLASEARAVKSTDARERSKAQTNKTVESDHPVGIQAPLQPDHEEIAQRAYTYWQSRGSQDGSADDDWLRAENELRK